MCVCVCAQTHTHTHTHTHTDSGNDINKEGIEPDVVTACKPTEDVKCVPLSFFGGKSFKEVDVDL